MGNRNDYDEVLQIAGAAKYFRTPGGDVYADINIRGHRETWNVESEGFQDWLRNAYHEAAEMLLRPAALKAAIAMLKARTRAGGAVESVYLRTAVYGSCLYIDLCNDDWKTVCVSQDGWAVVRSSPVRFHRSAGMRSLPVPKRGGTIKDVRSHLGKMSDQDFVLTVCWLLSTLRGKGPYPLLSLSGPQGSSKSTTARRLREMVDPNHSGLRSLPAAKRDLFLAATHALVLSFDNLSNMPSWMSDAFCQVSTGASYVGRRNYTLSSEAVLSASAPIILNGIVNVVDKPDLAERTLFVELKALTGENRKSEQDIDKAFMTAQPRLLGVLLDGLAAGLKNHKNIPRAGYARMQDFAEWSSACETAYWPVGTAEAAIKAGIQQSNEALAESDAVIEGIREYITTSGNYRGTAQNLLLALTAARSEQGRGDRQWPKNPRALSEHLKRIEGVLSKLGYQIQSGEREGRNRDRILTITQKAVPGEKPMLVAKTATQAPICLPEISYQADFFGSANADTPPP